MKIEIISLVTGTFVGILFALIKLPVPAPLTLAGVLGVVGIWTGYAIVKRFF